MSGEFGIGVDIERVSRFSAHEIKSTRFLHTFLTDKEIEYCYSKSDPPPHVAARFAGKEAVIKALSSLAIRNISFRDIEISNDDCGTPSAIVTFGSNLNIHVEISLSHGGDYAIAFAVAVKGLRS